MTETSLPDGRLLAYYGDDFTGSTDVMQVCAAAGLETVLFLRTPSAQDLARVPNARVIGIAGDARSRSPQWMDANLPAIFNTLATLGAPILQYKVCSTFDSSPTTGSIGRAIDIGVNTTGGTWSPMIIGAPSLKRYQAFGNLFAIADGVGHRLDRHPTMRAHPVTPMHEADLRLHLRAQTNRRIELIDLTQLQSGTAPSRRDASAGDDAPIVLFDAIDHQTLHEAGRTIWEGRHQGNATQTMSASSSGLPAALIAHWREQKWLAHAFELPAAQLVNHVLVVSGSCSPVTAAQIAWAQANGFCCTRIELPAIFAQESTAIEIARIVEVALTAIARGQSPVIYSATGSDDPAVRDFDRTCASVGISRAVGAKRIGDALAQIVKQILQHGVVRRVVVAGGDSSGAVMQALDATALTIAGLLEPGAPLCRISSHAPQLDGIEVSLKGGQMGAVNFFEIARRGKAT